VNWFFLKFSVKTTIKAIEFKISPINQLHFTQFDRSKLKHIGGNLKKTAFPAKTCPVRANVDFLHYSQTDKGGLSAAENPSQKAQHCYLDCTPTLSILVPIKFTVLSGISEITCIKHGDP
jgi:hypothetical protein